MVHLAFFDNFTVPSPLPPYNVGSVRSKCPPWSNIVWGGGGRAKFGKKSRFYYRTGGDNDNKANTFDQDSRLKHKPYQSESTVPESGGDFHTTLTTQTEKFSNSEEYHKVMVKSITSVTSISHRLCIRPSSRSARY